MPKIDKTLIRCVTTLVANPFRHNDDEATEASKTLSQFNIPNELRLLISDGAFAEAKQLLLAVGFQHSKSSINPNKILPRSILPTELEKKLPRPRGAYIAVAAAAGRAFLALTNIKGNSAAMQRARAKTWAACFGDSLLHALELRQVIADHDILLFGETGTGKELFARAILRATLGDESGKPAPSSAINAAAIPEALVESELFGHVKGSFTGATETRTGRLRSAHQGAFFLDEVGDLPQTTQVKLLRVIETNEVVPVGSDLPHSIDVRYIAGTHRDLEAMVSAGDFRRDLFERLAGNILRLPPLRDRPEDVLDIGMNFIDSYTEQGMAQHRRKHVKKWLESSEARNHRWPGNVRELQNSLRNLILGLPPGLKSDHETSYTEQLPLAFGECTGTMVNLQDWYIQRVLSHCDSNINKASQILGMDRSTLRRKLNQRASSKS